MNTSMLVFYVLSFYYHSLVVCMFTNKSRTSINIRPSLHCVANFKVAPRPASQGSFCEVTRKTNPNFSCFSTDLNIQLVYILKR